MASPAVLSGERVPVGDGETIHGVVAAIAARQGEAEALRWIEGGVLRHMGYRELVGRARLLADRLRQQGLQPGGTVAVCLERGPEVPVALLAVLQAGGCYLPIDPGLPLGRIAWMVSDGEARLLISRRELWAQPPSGTVLVEPDPASAPAPPGTRSGTDEESSSSGSRRHRSKGRSGDLAYVIYTSGSTGRPKGAEITHAGVLRLCRSRFITWSGEVFLHHSAVGFDLSTFEIWGPLLNGGICALASSGALSLDELDRQIGILRVRTLWLSAGLFHAMVDHRLACLGRLRQLVAGGDALSPAHVERVLAAHPRLLVVDGYGPTECTTFISCHRMQGPQRFPAGVPIGIPIANTQVAVLDDALRPLGMGEVGELCAAGDGVARGYRNRQELTAERFVMVELPGHGRVRMYRTGDRARIGPDGLIAFLGRSDDQVKLRGFRVELGEIESALARTPPVAEAVVAFRPQGVGDGQLDAYVRVPAEALAGDGREQARRWLEVYEATYAVPIPADPLFHVAGWNSSYDDRPLPEADLRELIGGTVARVRSLAPRRLLELGCGTGLLLLRLAPGLERCLGSDPSPSGLAHIRRTAAAPGFTACPIELHQAAADEDLGLPAGSLDTVMTNSVVQCFSSGQELHRVIERTLPLVASGGHLFIGDVRSLPLLAAHQAAIARHRADRDLPAGQVGWRIRQAADQEVQLVVSPAFFTALRRRHPRIGHIQVLLKRGRCPNEMLHFRYDVILHLDHAAAAPVRSLPWWELGGENGLRQLLTSRPGPGLVVTGIPNRRVARDVALAAAAQGDRPWGELVDATPEAGWDPQGLIDLAEGLGWRAEASWSGAVPDGSFDLLLAAMGEELPVAPGGEGGGAPERLVNDPLFGQRAANLSAELRRRLASELPAYMLPRSIQVLTSLPLTANGKVDKRALPPPEARRAHMREPEPPATPVERRLVELWEEMLGVAPIGVEDRFFDLGGTSLVAVAMLERIRTLCGGSPDLADFLRRPTVRGLAGSLTGASHKSGILVAVRREGQRIPIFSLCEYYDIAQHLDPGRPYVVVDIRYAEKVADTSLTVAQAAARGVEAVRRRRPDGPWLLAGHSYGAAVAWEMTRQIEAAGGTVAGLVIFDPPVLSSLGLRPSQAQRWFWHVRRLLASSPDEALQRLRRSLANARERGRQGDDDAIFADFRFLPIRSPILLVLCRDSYLRAVGSRDPRTSLLSLAGPGSEIAEVSGDHFTMLREPQVADTAREVDAWLARRSVG